LTRDKGSASGRAALLTIPVGEQRAFFRYAVDVGRSIAHQSKAVGAYVRPADVITHDEKNIGPFSRA
jgi:hypothetical protein